MSSEPERDARGAKPKSLLDTLVWVLIPTLLVIAGLALLFDLT